MLAKIRRSTHWTSILLFVLVAALAWMNLVGCEDDTGTGTGISCVLQSGVTSASICQNIASSAGCTGSSWSSTTLRCTGTDCPASACP